CRGGTVTISGCGPESHRNLGDSSCKYCTTLMGIGDYPFTFSGSTILIRNSEDWEIMARMINDAWYSPRAIRFALTNDITVSTMIGVKEAPFRAVFDGQGHTLTFECTTDETGAAPFRYVKNATFEHLRVAGTIITFGREAAGLANNVTESCTITDCVSAISIREVGTGILRGKHAGFVSRYSGADVTLTGCAFTGSISGRNADHCAGFLGAGDGTVHYCVYDGTMNTGGDSTDFIRDSTYGDNCYTFNSEGIDHVMGLLPFRVSAAEDVTVDFGGSTTYSVSGISACPNGIICDGTFYAGEGQTLNLGLSACPEQGCAARYTVSAGELVRGFGTWLITMPAADVLISAEYIPIQGFGTPDLVLPRAVTAIEEEAFEGISAGTVYLHDGCREIGERAFRNCGNLTKIRIPEGCVISADAFDGCTQVFIYGTALSTAEDYCETHANCIFVDETGNGE
nr:leucine-rich repeat domain-containing protein [Clostridiales bacterium]